MNDDLGKKGEKLLKDNLINNEQIIIKLKGTFKEAFVVTNSTIYILKWGFMTGNAFGGRCLAFNFNEITGIEFRKHFSTGYLEVLTPSTQNSQKSYWAKSNSGNSSLQADNVVSFQRPKFDIFQEAVAKTRDEISKFKHIRTNNNAHNMSQDSIVDELTKLASLKKQGILTQAEFDNEKAKILSR